MTEILGNNFFFDWEIRLMEWLQSAVGSPCSRHSPCSRPCCGAS